MQAYKYVPFGEVEQVIPYLVRRAQENSSVLGGVQKEKRMVAAEIRRRLPQAIRQAAARIEERCQSWPLKPCMTVGLGAGADVGSCRTPLG